MSHRFRFFNSFCKCKNKIQFDPFSFHLCIHEFSKGLTCSAVYVLWFPVCLPQHRPGISADMTSKLALMHCHLLHYNPGSAGGAHLFEPSDPYTCRISCCCAVVALYQRQRCLPCISISLSFRESQLYPDLLVVVSLYTV